MMREDSFVNVNRVFVDYTTRPGVLQAFIGKPARTQSVLRDISFRLDHGAWACVYGGEGAGKSTLLRLLAGALSPTRGSVRINGKAPQDITDLAAGYISSEESEPRGESVEEVLRAFGQTHQVANLPARLGEVSEILGLGKLLAAPADRLSSGQRLRVNLARAALADAPLILLDDTADHLGVQTLKELCQALFQGRTVIFATRFVSTAELLSVPILLLHKAQLLHTGTCEEIANELACPRVLEVWIEGLRYDLLRRLRSYAGVEEVRLVPSSRFAGQKLRIRLHSARYLPGIYDIISQAPLVRVQELPASLADIVARLQN